MKKILVFLLAGLLAIMFAACGGGASDGPASGGDGASGGGASGSASGGGSGDASGSADAVTWKFTHEEGAGEFQDVYSHKFKEVIEAASNGRITIEIYRVGELGEGVDQVEMLMNGGVQLGLNDPGWTTAYIPEANIFELHWALPEDILVYNKIMHEGEMAKYLSDLYEQNNMHVIDWIPSAYYMWTADKPLQTPADYKGFKMRTMAAPIIQASYQAYGADTMTTPYLELYSALQLKMADGQTNPLYGIVGMKFYEVQSSLTVSKPNAFVSTFCANPAFWAGLSDEDKQLVEEAAQAANDYIMEYSQTYDEEKLAELEAYGTNIVELTDEQKSAFKEASTPVRGEYLKLAPAGGQKMLDLLEQDVANIK